VWTCILGRERSCLLLRSKVTGTKNNNKLLTHHWIFAKLGMDMYPKERKKPITFEVKDTYSSPRTRVAQWVRSLDQTTHTSLSPIRRGFAPGFVNYIKGCTRLAAASDKVYQLLDHGRWFSPASSTTKSGRHDIAEILLKVALNANNQIKSSPELPEHIFPHIAKWAFWGTFVVRTNFCLVFKK